MHAWPWQDSAKAKFLQNQALPWVAGRARMWRLTVHVLHEDKAAKDANKNSHHCAASHIEGVPRVGLQRAPLQHAVLVPEVRRVIPAARDRPQNPDLLLACRISEADEFPCGMLG